MSGLGVIYMSYVCREYGVCIFFSFFFLECVFSMCGVW